MSEEAIQQTLASLLHQIALCDPSYDQSDPTRRDYKARNALIYYAMALAAKLDYYVGVKQDADSRKWVIAYIDLPTGQISWHLPAYEGAWDGHTTNWKYDRIHEYTNGRLV